MRIGVTMAVYKLPACNEFGQIGFICLKCIENVDAVGYNFA